MKAAATTYTINLHSQIYGDHFLPFTTISVTPTSTRAFTATVISGTLQKNNKTINGHIKLTAPNQLPDVNYSVARWRKPAWRLSRNLFESGASGRMQEDRPHASKRKDVLAPGTRLQSAGQG